MNPVLHYRNDDGSIVEIGPEHPDYAELLAAYRAANPNAPTAPTTSRWEIFKMGSIALAMGTAALWWEYTSLRDSHKYSPKLEFIGAMLVLIGLVAAVICMLPKRLMESKQSEAKPHPGGPTKLQMAGLIAVMAAGAAIAGLSAYAFHHWALNRLGLE